jgi:hypothetical protein
MWTAATHGNKVGGVCGGLGIEEDTCTTAPPFRDESDDADGWLFVVFHVSFLSHS